MAPDPFRVTAKFEGNAEISFRESGIKVFCGFTFIYPFLIFKKWLFLNWKVPLANLVSLQFNLSSLVTMKAIFVRLGIIQGAVIAIHIFSSGFGMDVRELCSF